MIQTPNIQNSKIVPSNILQSCSNSNHIFPKPVTFVVFGGTGDLAKRKLIGAFSLLISQGLIAKNSSFIGIGRTDYNDQTYKLYLEEGKDSAQKANISNVNVKFYRGDVSDPKCLHGLKSLIESTEKDIACNHRLYYLATSFTLFPSIVKELKRLDLNSAGNNFHTKIIFEKPFGKDLASNNLFEKAISKVFDEDQIYRIDHYLGKETIININTLKFQNPIFESLLNNHHVEKIEIIVDEDLKVDKRISYYNEFGAIKDMIQSHLLQVLSLLLMDNPNSNDANKIHAEKVKVLKKIKLELSKNNILGQYASYKDELIKYNIATDSASPKTETFAKLHFTCNNKRWAGVDLSLRTGKALVSKYGQIIVTFKNNSSNASKTSTLPNKLIVNIQPIQDIELVMNHLENGKIEQVNMNFCHACKFGPNSTDGYEKMIGEIIKGDLTLFANAEEIKESWKIVEDIEKNKAKIPFKIYSDFTNPSS